MKKTFTLTESDIKAVIAEKFKVDPKEIYINLTYGRYGSNEDPEVEIVVETDIQNYDL